MNHYSKTSLVISLTFFNEICLITLIIFSYRLLSRKLACVWLLTYIQLDLPVFVTALIKINTKKNFLQGLQVIQSTFVYLTFRLLDGEIFNYTYRKKKSSFKNLWNFNAFSSTQIKAFFGVSSLFICFAAQQRQVHDTLK